MTRFCACVGLRWQNTRIAVVLQHQHSSGSSSAATQAFAHIFGDLIVQDATTYQYWQQLYDAQTFNVIDNKKPDLFSKTFRLK